MAGVLTCIPALVTAQSVRCGNKVISTGITLAEVAARCGEPAQVEHKSAYLSLPVAAAIGQRNSNATATIEVQIEVWTYNFGSNKLMQRIRFEDGIVARIESLGYGY
jgi:hypothetical protein